VLRALARSLRVALERQKPGGFLRAGFLDVWLRGPEYTETCKFSASSPALTATIRLCAAMSHLCSVFLQCHVRGRWPTVRCEDTQHEKRTLEFLPPRSGIGPKPPRVTRRHPPVRKECFSALLF